MESLFKYFLVKLILSIFLISECIAWWPREYPRIGLHRWLEIDEEEHIGSGLWRTDFENITQGYLSIIEQGQTFVVSSQITGLAIDCNASYPVQWIAHNEEMTETFSYYTRVRYIRTNPDVFNPRSNLFTAQLDFYGESSFITGNYSCVSTEYPDDVIKSVYLFWQGTNPSNLVLGGKTIDVQSKDGHTVILPCRVSKPDLVVNLYKEVNSFYTSMGKILQEYVLVKSPYIKNDPKIGFTLNLYQYTGAYGKWKCSVGDDDDEAVFINIKQGVIDAPEFNNTISGNATLYFNKPTQEIICCSNSAKPPKLHTLFCVENFACELRRHSLRKIFNNGKKFRNGTCTSERIYQKDSGMLRCMGDGIDLVRNFYTDLPTKKNNHSTNLYFSWKDIKPEAMVEISITSRRPVYQGQNITVSCDTSFNYFSDGMQWAVRWKNGSLKFFPTPYGKGYLENNEIYETGQVSYQSIRLQVNMNMSEILCFSPIWNSTDWVNKTFTLDVHETKAPVFENPNDEVITWALNDTEQILQCRVKGSPTPAIRWKKNNKTLLPESNIVFKRQNGTSLVTVHRVSHDSQAEYKCIASNFGGTVEKQFIVFVEDPSSPLGAAGLTVLVLMIMVLVGGMGFLIWKMQLQKKIIDHLAGIVFRDVGDNSTNASNTENSTGSPVVTANGNSDRNPFPSSQG